MIVVHVTHEAVEKIGGIGTVIEGLTTATAYRDTVSRTILVGPLLSTDRPVNQRLGPDGSLHYSSMDEITAPPWREKFRPIETTYDVGIIYGSRKIHEPYSDKIVEVEVLLVDVFHCNQTRLNLFKGEMFRKFGVRSDNFEDIWEYEQYVRIAEPALEALKAIGVRATDEQVVLLSHEYMGMPTALKAVLDGQENVKTVFYAHEVASVRPIVEKEPGHDTMFYNVLGRARERKHYIEQIFPQVQENFKHPLVEAARFCDHIFAVGDQVVEELRFLDEHFERMGIDLVYNGIPSERITLDQKHASRALLKKYATNLLGRTPDGIFTHVARPVLSKGIWRDVRVLHEMEPLLKARGETAVYFMLGTLGGVRRPQDVRQMEQAYGWPAQHEVGYPDVCGGEEVIYESFDVFNRNHEASRALLVNQWGWSAKSCGDRMPPETTLADLRRGCDLEFGLSVYEPFGISQFEPLTFGALCAVSNVCGCTGFGKKAMTNGRFQNIVVADFLGLPEEMTEEQVLDLSIAQRDDVETQEARRLAKLIVERLPRDDEAMQRLLDTGRELAERMSWERVVQEYFLPSLTRAANE